MFRHHKKVPHALLSQRLRPQKPPPQINAPLSAAVESDIVGYTRTPIAQLGFDIISVPFVPLDGKDSQAVHIQDIKGTLSQNDSEFRADRLYVSYPGSVNYVVYHYKSQGWTEVGTDKPADDLIPPGTAFFIYKMMNTGEITVSGKVLDAPSLEVPVSTGLTLVANPYPTKLPINSITGENLNAHSSDIRADKIMVPDYSSAGYITYVLRPEGWVKSGETEPTKDSIDIGKGFFFSRMFSPTKLVFTRPY